MSDINELFARDPLELSDTDIEAVVKQFRDMRYRFAQGDTKAGSVKKPKAPAGVKSGDLANLLGEIKL